MEQATASGLYAGEYKSAIVRAKKILLAAGFAWSKTTGRYTPFAGFDGQSATQKTTHGVRVTRVGCSDHVALHVYNGTYGSRDEARGMQRRALEALRAAGMPFDDRGWLECGPRARAKLLAKQKEESVVKQKEESAVKYPRSFREAFASLTEEECRAAYYVLAQAVDNNECGAEECGVTDGEANEDTKKLFEHNTLSRAAVDKIELLFVGLAEKKVG